MTTCAQARRDHGVIGGDQGVIAGRWRQRRYKRRSGRPVRCARGSNALAAPETAVRGVTRAPARASAASARVSPASPRSFGFQSFIFRSFALYPLAGLLSLLLRRAPPTAMVEEPTEREWTWFALMCANVFAMSISWTSFLPSLATTMTLSMGALHALDARASPSGPAELRSAGSRVRGALPAPQACNRARSARRSACTWWAPSSACGRRATSHCGARAALHAATHTAQPHAATHTCARGAAAACLPAPATCALT